MTAYEFTLRLRPGWQSKGLLEGREAIWPCGEKSFLFNGGDGVRFLTVCAATEASRQDLS